MINDKQIQKAIRTVAASGNAVELCDAGHRGGGRLVLRIKPAGDGKAAADWYAVYRRGKRRACMKEAKATGKPFIWDNGFGR